MFAFNLAIRVAGGQLLKRWKQEMRGKEAAATVYVRDEYAAPRGESGGWRKRETRLGKPTEKGGTSYQNRSAEAHTVYAW